jgi:glutamine---fructose-6-phosphate transaminase (isomerizing)
MCGIVAVLRRRTDRAVPTAAEILSELPDVSQISLDARRLDAAAAALSGVDSLLSGVPGLRCLLGDADLVVRLEHECRIYEAAIADLETGLEAAGLDAAGHERINARLLALKDAVWAIGRDRIRTARGVDELGGGDGSLGALETLLSVQEALSSLDRLEVRGRDSAGLHLLLHSHALDLSDPAVAAEVATRAADPNFGSGSVRAAEGGALSFVYKTAAEIGELGDNGTALRAAIIADNLLRRALDTEDVVAVVLGHTRWASVGIVSEPNSHPLNSDQQHGEACPYVTAVLNGDVDNFADVRELEQLDISTAITTDAKVIPTLMAKNLGALADSSELTEVDEAFRRTVAALDGSVAIASSAAVSPNHLHLALRGSGQALYVGFAEDAYIVASEPYGVVEVTPRYLRMDGETPGNLDNPTASRGQIISLDGSQAGTVAGVRRVAYDGTEMPVQESEIVTVDITTRDIDRGSYPHFLLKEITESPQSFRKTLRGKLVDNEGALEVRLGDETLPAGIRQKLRTGEIDEILVIGQGTAAIAGESLALLLGRLADVHILALPATELSGFHLRSDMSDTLVIAISQSGTTTDTNRTVDLVRARGGSVVAIVNRRNSDLTDRSDGVLYTSDGRDIEMSVPSTKAFYSQIAAGALLAVAIAREVEATVAAPLSDRHEELLRSLREIPAAMEAVIGQRSSIGAAASQFAPSRRYWAIVGSGPNIVAAREIRIKLSELCYKAIAADYTEDKKHIDLSSEPMILVCATGLVGSTASDVAKEVAIYRAHKAAPIVIADEGASFPAALHLITVPSVDPALAFVLSTVAGHLFGYEAALSIDSQARPLRETRAAIEQAVTDDPSMLGEAMLDTLQAPITRAAHTFLDGLRSGEYNGHLEASTATRMASLFRYATGTISLDSYQLDHGKVGTPATVLEDLTVALTLGIEELTRPIDAIKHQAKTVTVGISRSDEELIELNVIRELLAAGTPRDRLSYRNLRILAALDPAVEQVLGFIRYRIEGDPASESSTLSIVDRGGVARDIASRVERDPALRGSKHLVAAEQIVTITRGRNDGRTIIMVPEVKDKQTVGITLLHVSLLELLPEAVIRGVLQGYRNRYAALRDYVTESEPSFRDDLLATVSVGDLLVRPILDLAELWRA